ncbi:MAG: SNF2-related protein [Candidatus Kryptoniota bacterium]
MQIKYTNGVFYSVSKYEEKDLLKGAGFRWSPENRYWWTDSEEKVLELMRIASSANGKIYFDELAGKEIKERMERKKENMTLSSSFSLKEDIDIPLPMGLTLYPYQKVGVKFILNNKDILLADEMGLGKTIQVLAYLNLTSNIRTALIVCPASLKLNWEREAKRWLTRSFNIILYDGELDGKIDIQGNTILIINYEGVRKYADLLKTVVWDLMVLDESYYIKNMKAQRTKVITGYRDRETGEIVKGLKDSAKQKILLTGTPVLNKPIELYTQLKVLGHPLAKNYSKFKETYVIEDEWGSAVGGKNLEELQRTLRETVMLRREKKDVLKELPAKTRQVITLPSSILSPEEIKEDQKYIEIVKQFWDEKEGRLKIRPGSNFPFDEIAKIRHRTAVKKLPYVIDMIEDILENEEKVVVFAHHLDVIQKIYEAFPDISVRATGQESLTERDEAVGKFQNDPKIRVFVASIQAMGVGITLTSSSTVLFAEIEWRPGDLTQAEDRLHRIGQKGNVLAQYVLVDESIDAYMMAKILAKIDIIEKITNIDLVPEREEVTLETLDKVIEEERYKPVPKVPEEIAQPVLTVLKMLAELDTDMARARNGVGFNQTDTSFGHRLAELTSLSEKQYEIAKRIIKKYHRQIPEELYAQIYGVS